MDNKPSCARRTRAHTQITRTHKRTHTHKPVQTRTKEDTMSGRRVRRPFECRPKRSTTRLFGCRSCAVRNRVSLFLITRARTHTQTHTHTGTLCTFVYTSRRTIHIATTVTAPEAVSCTYTVCGG